MATALSVKMRGEEVMSIFEGICGGNRNARAYVATVLITVANSPDLQECSSASIIKSATQAATLRLSVDPATREAWLIPRKNTKKGCKEANFQIGAQGYYNMGMRTELYRYINVDRMPAGYSVDFDFITGAPKIVTGDEYEGGVIASFELYKGFSKTVFWTYSDLEAHRKKYAPYNKVWNSNREAMEEKTVMTDLLKNWGVFTDGDKMLLASFEAEDEIEAELDLEPVDVETDPELEEIAAVSEAAKVADQPKEAEEPTDERNWTDTKLNWLVTAQLAIDIDDAAYMLGLSKLPENSPKADILFWSKNYRAQIELPDSSDFIAANNATNIFNRHKKGDAK